MGRRSPAAGSGRKKSSASQRRVLDGRDVGNLRAGAESQPAQTPGRPKQNAAGEYEAIVVTHGFDPGDSGEPYAATIRIQGRRAGVSGKPRPGDSFVQLERIERVVPGTGPISITTWIYALRPGEWSVTASLQRHRRPEGPGSGSRSTSRQSDEEPLSTVGWSWRARSLTPGSRVALIKTRWAITAPLASIPAVVQGSLPVLVAIGALIGIVVQTWILATKSFPIERSLMITAVAIISGFVAAKLWYGILNPGRPVIRGGWAVDGFMIATPLVALTALVVSGLPVGAYFDASAPALFLTIAVGRVGCFFTGCCAGHASPSRWALWSSDRRVGARRIPTQLTESAVGLGLGLATIPLVLVSAIPLQGAVFVLALGLYMLARQALLRVRAEPRRHLWDRHPRTATA